MADETHVERLFLGGPLNGRRIMVELGSWQYMALRPMPMVWTSADSAFDTTMPTIAYTLRRTPDLADRVFVAPDFTYDTPEWLAFDTVAWVARLKPLVEGWEHRGPWRWRGRPPEGVSPWLARCWLYVLGDGRGESYVQQAIAEEMAADLIAGDEVIFDHMQHELDHHLLPTCVVPDCTEKAPVELRAAESGRLAGRAWHRGDEIRLCPEHYYDVMRAQGAYGVDQLAEWLRPDARVSPEDHLWAVAARIVAGEPYESLARTLRISQKVQADG